MTTNIHNKEAFEYNQSVHKDLMIICKPLFANLEVKNFRYMKMYSDYKYISLGTNLNFIKAYLQYIDKPGEIFEPANIFAQGFMSSSNLCHFLWPAQCKKTAKDPLYNLVHEFNIWHGFTLSKVGHNYVETWSFTADKDATRLAQFYLKNASVFDCFVLYFDNKIQHVIKSMPKSALATFRSPFRIKVYSDNISAEKIGNFFKQLDLSKFLIGNNLTVYLTAKEIECLTYVALGSTAKQTGKILNISPRTVEVHLQSIKQKLSINYKSEFTSIIPYEKLLLLEKIISAKLVG
jgi:DNA-binding CsgD family transcriptional regulator